MDTAYHTLQDFYLHTKGVAYLLMVAALVGLAYFWRYLSAKDDPPGTTSEATSEEI